jgi:hypothetical protein
MAMSIAKFPYVRDLAGFDFKAQPSLDPSHVVTIRGDSCRLREKRRSGLLKPAPEPSALVPTA